MYKTKRLLTEQEMDKFLALREESSVKAAKYMKSLENELFEVTEEAYAPKSGRKKSSRDSKTTEDRLSC